MERMSPWVWEGEWLVRSAMGRFLQLLSRIINKSNTLQSYNSFSIKLSNNILQPPQSKNNLHMSLQLQIQSQQNLPHNIRQEKNTRVKSEQTKMIELIDSFYAKAKNKIEKTLTKDNKKTTILCEEIFRALAQHPKQELYEISRLNDAFFNQITTLTNTVCELLKSMEALVVKMGSQLSMIKQRSLKKQEKQCETEKKIVVLRKIQFKKEKKSLATKLKNIDTINKKLIRFEDNNCQNSTACVMDIEGKRVESKLVNCNKIYFCSKNREYLLCTVMKNASSGQLVLMNDKLQAIANFSKVPPINLATLVKIVQIQDFLYIVHTHSILRINLLNEDMQLQEFMRQKIVLAEANSTQLILWTKDQNSIISVVFLTEDLQPFYAQKLPLSAKTISHCFKIQQQSGDQLVYFISRSAFASPQLWIINNQQTKLLSREIGIIDEIISLQNESVVFRKGGQFFIFAAGKVSKRMLQIQTETVQQIQKCCIIGEHLYCLHQSGKYMLECHFRSLQSDQSPE